MQHVTTVNVTSQLDTYILDDATHASLSDSPASENLHRILCCFLSSARSIHLQERNLTRKLVRLLLVAHIVHLEGDVFNPTLRTLDTRYHLRELCAYHSLRRQRLPENSALIGPPDTKGQPGLKGNMSDTLHAFLDNEALCRDAGTAHDPSFMVEIRQYNTQSAVFWPECIFQRNLDIIERHERSTGSG